MKNHKSSLFSIIFFVLFLNSLIYHSPQNDLLNVDDSTISDYIESIEDIIPDQEEILDDQEPTVSRIKKVDTPGDYQLQGYFFHNDVLDIDADGLGFELEEYEIMKDDGANCVEERPRFDSTDSQGLENTWPPDTTNFHEFTSPYSPNEKSHFFTPIFDEETYIKGKAHFVLHITNQWSGTVPTIDFRISLYLHNTNDSSNTLIASTTEYGIDYEFWSSPQRLYDITIPGDYYTIPAGYRLKIKFEGRISDLAADGEFKIYCADITGGETYTWSVTDPGYENTYSVEDVNRIFGAQFYMNNEFPDISVSGLINDTITNIKRNISVTVTGADNSSYRWNNSPYTSFDTITWFWTPETHGWHTLDIQAMDDYGNNRTVTYNLGFDESLLNLALISPTNGSLIGDSSTLEFEAYNITYAMYEWDKDGNQYNLTANGYLIQDSLSSGEHNLTVTTYDDFGTEDFFYIFTYDASPASIVLLSPTNNSIQPAGKVIDISITDETSLDVQYKWDTQDKFTWLPFSGYTYRTYLPGLDGAHILYLYVNDSFGHFSYVEFWFTTDNTVLGVELQNLINNSHYYGGNDVNLTITGSNTTVYYNWDNGAESSTTLTESFLLLIGGDALPSVIGYHNLTIRTFDISDIEEIFFFNFTVDQEAPTINSSIYTYDNDRFTSSDSFVFTISDNNADLSELDVFYSIDGGFNNSISVPHGLDLAFFTDGTYVLTLYVYDVANNFATASFTFTIDETPPVLVLYDIEGLAVVQGTFYVPKDSLVTISISDDDAFNSTFSWNGGLFNLFTNTFVLDFTDGPGTLIVNASDTLSNHDILLSIDLYIDNLAPEISLNSPLNDSKLNEFTELNFIAEDNDVQTIKKIVVSWDKFYPASSPIGYDSLGYFDLILHSSYDENDDGATVILYITAEDVVGNSKEYIFTFIIDMTAPKAAFFIDDPLTPEIDFQDAINFDYFYMSKNVFVPGNTSIWYNASLNADLVSISYEFDNNDSLGGELNLLDPWIYVPLEDGLHNLTVILVDNTEGSLPNKNETIYFFYVDDMTIDLLEPSSLDNIQLTYGDAFNFTLRIYDYHEDTAIENLFWNQTTLASSNNLSLVITNSTINNQTFQFFIYTTTVGNTSLIFEFSKGESNKHFVIVNLSIERKKGYLTLLDTSSSSELYGDSLTIQLTLQDDVGQNISVSEIFVNGTRITPIINHGNDIFEFSYSPHFSLGRGTYNLLILVNSELFYGVTNTSYVFEFEILPLPTELSIFVSEYNVTEGNNVIISALLTFDDGTPISGADILFYVYIYYKNDSFGVQALTPGYDHFEILPDITNSTGYATVSFQMTEEIEFISIIANYTGSEFNEEISFELSEVIRSIKPSGLPTYILYIIIAGAVVLIAITSYLIYRFVKQKPIEQLMEEIEEDEILKRMIEINPGAVLTSFDQRRGAIPLVHEDELESGYYKERFPIGVDNFLLKIADQAYSSLGFEEKHDRRRIGSIILPTERMVGFIHGIQLPNKMARGGFENLALIVLVNEKHDKALLGNQTYLYDEIDELAHRLKSRQTLEEIKLQLHEIRLRATRIVLAAMSMDKDASE